MSRRFLIPFIVGCAVVVFTVGVFQLVNREVELKHFPLDGLNGVITKSGVEIDKNISTDGNGSLRITATEPTVIHLFEVKNINVEGARLIYQAKVRTENLVGDAYLEMKCIFPEEELLSRGRTSRITGTADWTTQETTFYLAWGKRTKAVKLNLIIRGNGIVWVDDIRLVKAPLH